MTSTTDLEPNSQLEQGSTQPDNVYNPHPQIWGPPTAYATKSDRIICVLVGLPARGKSYIARRLGQYLRFFHNVPVKYFNVGEYRRKSASAQGVAFQSAEFFDSTNAEAAGERAAACDCAMQDMCDWMKAERPTSPSPSLRAEGEGTYPTGDFGAVAMFDATNTTKARREWIIKQTACTGAKLIFIESIMTDDDVIDRNIKNSKLGVKDYLLVDDAKATADFKERIAHYAAVYETVTERHLSWIKLVDGGREIATCNIRGYLPTRIMTFLMNLHMQRSPFYFTRHGQSEYNALGRIGGDSGLTDQGEAYAEALGDFVDENISKPNGLPTPARLWTSTMSRTMKTARHVKHHRIEGPDGVEWVNMRPKCFRNLDELYAGTCDGMTMDEIEAAMPEEAKMRKEDKFNYRYPRGESYIDLIARLEPMVHEFERQREPILVVAHQAILRVLYAYFTGLAPEECIECPIPLNTVIKITPTASGFDEERFYPVGGLTLDPALLDPASH